MKHFFTLLLLAVATTVASAANMVDKSTAKAVGLQFLQNHHIEVSSLQEAELPDSIGFYAFNAGNEEGYVLVSAYDGVKPILGYATTGHFKWSELPSNASHWLKGYQNAIRTASANNSETTEAANAWECLKNGESTGSNLLKASSSNSLATSVDPLCTANWWQYTLYYTHCPTNGVDTAVCGCVATSMGIVMKHWNYPATGNGSITYTDANYGTISADFSQSVYDWDNMPSRLAKNSSQAHIDAVAYLLADCAISIQSQFGNAEVGTGGRLVKSKTYPKENAQYALPTYFGYDANAIKGVVRSNYTTNNWKKLIKTELSEGRPVIYDGTNKDATDAHCFVCDGYDADGYFHFNWGWAGALNGYFSIDSMMPYTDYDYSYNQEALIGITPPESYLSSGTSNINSIQVAVYPNPATSQLNVSLPEGKVATHLALFSPNGQLVETVNATNTMDVSVLPRGIYYLTGDVDGQYFEEKVEVR